MHAGSPVHYEVSGRRGVAPVDRIASAHEFRERLEYLPHP